MRDLFAYRKETTYDGNLFYFDYYLTIFGIEISWQHGVYIQK